MLVRTASRFGVLIQISVSWDCSRAAPACKKSRHLQAAQPYQSALLPCPITIGHLGRSRLLFHQVQNPLSRHRLAEKITLNLVAA